MLASSSPGNEPCTLGLDALDNLLQVRAFRSRQRHDWRARGAGAMADERHRLLDDDRK